MLYDKELLQLATAIVCASGDAADMEGTTVVRMHDVLRMLSTYSDQGTTVTADGGAIQLTHPQAH